MKAAIIPALALAVSSFAQAQTQAQSLSPASAERPHLTIPLVATAPHLDDYLRDAARPPAAKISAFVQRHPGDGNASSRETTAYLSYDRTHLYVVFECKDAPTLVRAHLSRREDILGDDRVGVALDTFRDGQRAYMFFANPLGVQLDGITTEGQDDDYAYDTVWNSSGRMTDSGYLVLLEIPFKSLRFEPSDDMRWRIALSRFIPSAAETSTWPLLTERLEAYVPQFGELDGLRSIDAPGFLQLQPYESVSARRLDAGGGQTGAQEWKARTGLDGKVVIREAAALDLTLNPDFSQVESDEPQPTINQRYEVYFPEKRPFFNDGAGLFTTPETVLFTRRIVDPLVGARLTAKAGDWVIAGLATRDRAADTSALDPRPYGPGTAFVGRIVREHALAKLGGIWAVSTAGPRSNAVGALDGRWLLGPSWSIDAQALASREVDADTQAGTALYAGAHHSSRHLRTDTVYRQRSPGFRGNTLGFFRRTDIRELAQYTGYDWRPRSGAIVSTGPAVDAEVNWDTRGELQDWFVDLPWRVNTTGPASLSLARRERFDRYRGVAMRYHDVYLATSVALGGTLDFRATAAKGTRPNYYPAAGLAPFVAPSREATMSVTLKPGSRWRITETYVFSALDELSPATRGPANLFAERSLRSKVSLQVTRPFSLRVIADWNDVLANPRLVTLEPTRDWTVELLGTYLVHPGTALYVGYTDRREAQTDPDAINTRVLAGTTTRGRLLFVKMSVLIRP